MKKERNDLSADSLRVKGVSSTAALASLLHEDFLVRLGKNRMDEGSF